MTSESASMQLSRCQDSAGQNTRLKSALLVCSLVGEHDRADITAFDLTIAVDGGTQWFKNRDVVPDIAAGDFDSIQVDAMQWLEATAAKVQKVPKDKDFSDLELALSIARDLGVEEVTVLGAIGRRIDHQICVLGALLRSSIPQVALLGSEDAGARVVRLLRAGDSLRLDEEAPSAETFSVISAEPATLSISGARWSLDRAEITPFSSHGLSNSCLGEGRVTITVHSGTAFVVIL